MPCNFPNPVNYLFSFLKLDQTKYFLVGTTDNLYLFDPFTNNFITLNTVPFTGGVLDRWQSDVVNDKLYLVNGVDPIQVFTPPTLAPLVETPVGGDFAMPQAARFVVNSVNHLLLANTTEAGFEHRTRVRWSDIDDPTVWVPDNTVNEAGFFDLAEGGDEVLGVGQLGPQRVVVYKKDSIYLLTYQGLPIIYNVDRIVKNEGLFKAYAFAATQDTHFFVGNRDFYAFGGIRPEPIGTQRIRDTFFGSVSFAKPLKIFAFIHPFFQEVWFVYATKDSETFNRCLVYNWEENVWCTRNFFPMSALGVFFSDVTSPISDLTWPFSDPRAQLTWKDKVSEGTPILISGDESGFLYQHGMVTTYDTPDEVGRPLLGTLETGNLVPAGRIRRARLSRVWIDNIGSFNFKLGCRLNPGDSIIFSDEQIVDGDGRADLLVVANEFRMHLEATGLASLGEFNLSWMPAGDR